MHILSSSQGKQDKMAWFIDAATRTISPVDFEAIEASADDVLDLPLELLSIPEAHVAKAMRALGVPLGVLCSYVVREHILGGYRDSLWVPMQPYWPDQPGFMALEHPNKWVGGALLVRYAANGKDMLPIPEEDVLSGINWVVGRELGLPGLCTDIGMLTCTFCGHVNYCMEGECCSRCSGAVYMCDEVIDWDSPLSSLE